jgi:phage/conjugal plasmid C-4 type zinc finger TraR family protein
MREYESIQGENLEEADMAQLLSVKANEDALAKFRASLPKGPSLTHCEDCGEEIPEARRKAVMGCMMCIECQLFHDRIKQRG